jgi:tripeptidyl-peptidase I
MLKRNVSIGPFVTAVGGTIGVHEVAVNFTGGGFSNYFEQPPYQGRAVSNFLSGLGNNYEGLFKYVRKCVAKIFC